MPIVVELCHRAACMNAGRLIAVGATRDVLKDRAVIEAYWERQPCLSCCLNIDNVTAGYAAGHRRPARRVPRGARGPGDGLIA
jgi:hypothetical protein